MKSLLLLVIVSLVHCYGQACSCIGKESFDEAFKKSELVVSARIIDVKRVKIWSDTTYAQWNYNPSVDTLTLEEYKFEERTYGFHELEYSFVVESTFKGADVKDTLRVRTGFGEGDCGFQFMVGEKYLIYAVSEHSIKYTLEKLGRSKKELRGIFHTTICDRTRSIKDAADDLRHLKRSK